MIRINLLPHRQAKRAQRQRQITAAAAMVAVLGLAIAAAGYLFISGKVEEQRARNAFLSAEIEKVKAQVSTIDDIKQKTEDMLERKRVVEALQTNRSEAVHVLDQMLRLLPEGTWLKSIKQTDMTVNISGYAQSNARVSTFMRSLEASQWLERAELVEIKATTVNNKRANEFTLNVRIKREKLEETAEGKKKTPKTGAKATQA